MNNEVNEEILHIKNDILEMKEELFKLNNLIVNIIKEFRTNLGGKVEDKDSREVENILNNCLDEF